ncbi:MAG: hypothetical protein COV52_00450 [Gammaproteobacteria bacterium CG11_big_fil_rev_8_21_14_0_20_46_22]|nr:MAG: hypothetical protein COW05_09065 [Gammaproteobacteria bacterium CG12_big_fil_rev_8_21_14_0_65_46_12]PIR12126.1 MAG: hypothetical protein COV52_00450 [Gammaproteobacteria bacterium CG11_big_fil_rev_8_21_14_0_20_46_22]
MFGLFDLSLTIANFLFLFFEGQIASAFERFYYEAKDEGKLPALSSSVLVVYAILMAALFFVALGTCFVFTWLHCFIYFHLALIVILFTSVPPKQLYFLLLANFRLDDLRRCYVIYSLAQMLITLFVSLLLLVVFKVGVVGAVWGAMSGYIILMPLVLVHFFILNNPSRFSWGYVTSLVKYGFLALPAVISSALLNSSGRFIVLGSISLTALGVYSAINRISTIFSLLVRSLNLVWSPMIIRQFRRPKNEVVSFLIRAIHLYAAGGMVTIFLVLLFAPVLFDLFFNKISNMYYYLVFPIIAFFWQGWSIIWTAAIDWTKKTHLVSVAVTAGAALTILLQLEFIRRYGLFAAFFSNVVGSILTTYVLTLFASKCAMIKVGRLFWWGNVCLGLLFPLLLWRLHFISYKSYYLALIFFFIASISLNTISACLIKRLKL